MYRLYSFYCTLFILLLTARISSQVPKSAKFNGSVVQARPSGNSIGVIAVSGDTVLIQSDDHLDITTDDASTWTSFSRSDGLYKGTISAIAIVGSKIFVATIFDSSLSPRPTAGVGGGITYSTNFGATWLHVPQPVDPPSPLYYPLVRDNGDTISVRATPRAIDNVIYDLAVTDSSIWIASFAGVVRHATMSPDGTIGPFTVATLPSDTMNEVRADRFYEFVVAPCDSGLNDCSRNVNHRGFSVALARDGVWVGTGGGINFSPDNGLSWKRYTAQNSGISGNFVVALGEQIYSEDGLTYRNIWAAGNRALDPAESNGVNVTADSGATWRVVLQGAFVNNMAFDGKTVWVAANGGLFRSDDLGLTWEKRETLVDAMTGDRTYTTEFSAVGVDQVNGIVYVGTGDGLCISYDRGETWSIPRAFKTPGVAGTPNSYAYPNPFSPSVEPNVARFQFDETGLNSATDRVTIRIYDFAMDLVSTVADEQPISQTVAWNGRNNKGQRVANGTYVYIIQAGKKKFWGKITVRN